MGSIRHNILSITSLADSGWRFTQGPKGFDLFHEKLGLHCLDVAYFANCPWVRLYPDVGSSSAYRSDLTVSDTRDFSVAAVSGGDDSELARHRRQGHIPFNPNCLECADPSTFQPMHGLKLVIKEDVLPQEQLPHFPAIERLAAKGLLAVDTWNSKRAMVNFKATIEVPMLGSIIESCGDTLDESHMPLGWPMSIDGAVRQFCMHKTATIQELDSMLEEFDLQRSSVEINRNTPQWSHNSVWRGSKS